MAHSSLVVRDISRFFAHADVCPPPWRPNLSDECQLLQPAAAAAGRRLLSSAIAYGLPCVYVCVCVVPRLAS